MLLHYVININGIKPKPHLPLKFLRGFRSMAFKKNCSKLDLFIILAIDSVLTIFSIRDVYRQNARPF